VADAMDIDGDGFIEQAEYAQLFHLANVGDEVVLAAFQRLDQDGDGRISTQEFRGGAAHAFLARTQQTRERRCSAWPETARPVCVDSAHRPRLGPHELVTVRHPTRQSHAAGTADR